MRKRIEPKVSAIEGALQGAFGLLGGIVLPFFVVAVAGAFGAERLGILGVVALGLFASLALFGLGVWQFRRDPESRRVAAGLIIGSALCSLLWGSCLVTAPR